MSLTELIFHSIPIMKTEAELPANCYFKALATGLAAGSTPCLLFPGMCVTWGRPPLTARGLALATGFGLSSQG